MLQETERWQQQKCLKRNVILREGKEQLKTLIPLMISILIRLEGPNNRYNLLRGVRLLILPGMYRCLNLFEPHGISLLLLLGLFNKISPNLLIGEKDRLR